jgi:DNA-binding CsgD family transcriptional regulator
VSSTADLTPREMQVLTLVLGGLGNKQIAAELGVTEQAIKEHVSGLLAKFDVPNRAALAEAGARLELTGELGFDRAWVRELFREAQPQICVLRGPDLRYEAVNDAFVTATGNRPAIGRTMRETFPELEGQGVFERVERVYATGEALIEHEVVRSWDRGEGIERRLVDLVLQPLHGEDGGVNGVVSFAVDVTEVVGTRRSLLLSDELAAIVELVPSGVLIVDASGQIVKWNEPVRHLLLSQFVAIRGYEDGTGLLMLSDGAGVPVALADLESASSPNVTSEPRAFSFLAGAPAKPVKFHATARVLREVDGHIRGAVLVLTDPS